MPADLLRPIAFAAAVPALVGVFHIAVGDVDTGMLWLLVPALASGLALSIRFHPLRLTGDGATRRMNATWKRTVIDIGWIALGYLVALLIGAVVTQVVDPDVSAFAIAPLLAFIAATTALLGVLASFIVILPLALLVGQLRSRIRGEKVDLTVAAIALLLLSVTAFAVSVTFATDIEGTSSRGKVLPAVLLMLTGIETENAQIASQPLLWVARLSIALVVACTVVLYREDRRRKAARS